MAEEEDPSDWTIEDLPMSLLEKIIDLVPAGDLGSCGRVSRAFLAAANRSARERSFRLYGRVLSGMARIKEELGRTPPGRAAIRGKISLARSYYMLEMLLHEMDVVRVVSRHILYQDSGNPHALAKLLQLYDQSLTEILKMDLPQWVPENPIEKGMIHQSKLYFDSRFAELSSLHHFGCLVMDILELLMHRQYNFDVIYDPYRNDCTIDGVYKVLSPQYLSTPPRLNEDSPAGVLTKEDKSRILDYFFSSLKVNRRITLREEQYFREFEASLENGPLLFLEKEHRTYGGNLRRTGHQLLPSDEGWTVRASFQSLDFAAESGFEEALVCFVRVRCPLDAAPLAFLAAWEELQADPAVGCRQRSEEPAGGLQPDTAPTPGASATSTGDYTFDCTLEAVIRLQGNLEPTSLSFHEP